ncbi:MAG: hypothetical protein NT180_01900 [Actinobacteria bacterium]|nr:hypothetical protein [Actinomycetota bacterium]
MTWFEEVPPIDPNRVTPGLLGLLSFIFLLVAVFLLWRSMRKQMKKIDPSLPQGKEEKRRADEQIPEEPDGSSGQ